MSRLTQVIRVEGTWKSGGHTWKCAKCNTALPYVEDREVDAIKSIGDSAVEGLISVYVPPQNTSDRVRCKDCDGQTE